MKIYEPDDLQEYGQTVSSANAFITLLHESIQISLNSKAVVLLNVDMGDKVIFGETDGKMYIAKSNTEKGFLCSSKSNNPATRNLAVASEVMQDKLRIHFALPTGAWRIQIGPEFQQVDGVTWYLLGNTQLTPQRNRNERDK